MKTQFLDGIENSEYVNHNGMILRRINGLNGEEYYQSLNGEFWQKVGGFFKKVGSGVVNVVSNVTSAKQTMMQPNQPNGTTPPTSANSGLTTAQILAMQNATPKQGLSTGAIVGIAVGGVSVVVLIAIALTNKNKN